MAKFYIGVDGGGTKTVFCAATGEGEVITQTVAGGCSYLEIGTKAALARIRQGIDECLASAQLQAGDCAGCAIGLPCYGESEANDLIMRELLEAALAPIPVQIVNDVEVARFGALGQGEGIHIVAGTGAIACGRDGSGATARCGGWNEFFGDEGSCYWVGGQAMALFTKQADGRAERGALHDLVMRALDLHKAEDFINVILRDWAPHRDKVAAFQRFAEQAAEAGDRTAAHLYEQAAEELALLAAGLLHRLGFSQMPVRVTYSGGLFKAGKWILRPLQQKITAIGGQLTEPLHTPTEGAVQLAIENFQEGI